MVLHCAGPECLQFVYLLLVYSIHEESLMKNSLLRCAAALIACGLIAGAGMSPASAGINYTFSPAADGGVDVVGTGTGFSDRSDPQTTSDWDVQDFITNFMVLDDGATLGAATESGTLTNVTTGISVNIVSFQIDEDGGLGDDNDIDFDTDEAITFNLGDEYAFSLMAHFEPFSGGDGSALTINDLVYGYHFDVGRTQGAGLADELFGITRVGVIPEPSSILLACGSIALFAAARRRVRS